MPKRTPKYKNTIITFKTYFTISDSIVTTAAAAQVITKQAVGRPVLEISELSEHSRVQYCGYRYYGSYLNYADYPTPAFGILKLIFISA